MVRNYFNCPGNKVQKQYPMNNKWIYTNDGYKCGSLDGKQQPSTEPDKTKWLWILGPSGSGTLILDAPIRSGVQLGGPTELMTSAHRADANHGRRDFVLVVPWMRLCLQLLMPRSPSKWTVVMYSIWGCPWTGSRSVSCQKSTVMHAPRMAYIQPLLYALPWLLICFCFNSRCWAWDQVIWGTTFPWILLLIPSGAAGGVCMSPIYWRISSNGIWEAGPFRHRTCPFEHHCLSPSSTPHDEISPDSISI